MIELLVVISIIGILVAVTLVGFTQARKSARDSKRKADIEQTRSALELYRSDVKTYPNAGSLPSPLTASGVTYLESAPEDPMPSKYQYVYHYIDKNKYCLCAYLESGTSSGSCDCGSTDCGASVSQACNYKVANP